MNPTVVVYFPVLSEFGGVAREWKRRPMALLLFNGRLGAGKSASSLGVCRSPKVYRTFSRSYSGPLKAKKNLRV